MKNDKVRRWFRKQWREWRVALFLIVFVVVPVKSSVADFNWVPSGSMKPTILEGDFVFVNKAAYDLRVPLTLHRVARWADPARGDIVICFSPDDGVRLIKRVVGLPGDTLEMRNNRLIINGQFAQQSAMPSQEAEALATLFHGKRLFAREQLGEVNHAIMGNPAVLAPRSFAPIRIPEHQYFVMGDNRDNSRDSRIFGFVDRRSIVGKAVGLAGSFKIDDKFQPRVDRFFQELQ